MTFLKQLFDEDRSSLPMILRLYAFCAVAFVAFWLTSCATYLTPDPSLIRWDQPYAWLEANLHAESISGGAWEITPTGSMEPFLTAGDYVVGQFDFPWKDIAPGMLLVYDPDWSDAAVPLVCHMAVAKSGDGWVMRGIANQYSESGSRALMREDYRARVVSVYTKRKKP